MESWCISLTVFYLIVLMAVVLGIEIRQAEFDVQEDLKNVVFTQNVLFASSVRSKLDCSRNCASACGSTFTFTKRDSRKGFCWCHSMIMTSRNDKTAKKGSTTYVRRNFDRERAATAFVLTTSLSPHNHSCPSDRVYLPDTCSRSGSNCICAPCTNGDLLFSGSSGYLTSPGYPGQHTNDMTCRYRVSLDPPCNRTVHVSMNYYLESKGLCEAAPCPDCFDYVIFNDDGMRYCGKGNVTKSFTATESWSILFVTDISVTTTGFVLYYHVD